MPKHIVHEGVSYEAVADIRLTPQGEDELAVVHVRNQDGDGETKKTLYVGVFFDGTGQNMLIDEPSYDSDISNIAKLYKAYPESKTPDGRGNMYQSIYQRGVGTLEEEEVRFWEIPRATIGLGLGIGSEGGHIRIKDTFDRLNRVPDLDTYDEIVFDVFGFSRGAALARHFTNLVNAWQANIRIPHLASGNISLLRPGILNLMGYETVPAFPQREGVRGRVRFLGLFDTVGSFYLPGNDSNLDFNLDLQADSAERVVQFTAHHEFRHNFPLTSIGSATGQLPANFYEEALPGVHVDVGGGYPDPHMATPHSGAWRIRVVTRRSGIGAGLDRTAVRRVQEEASRQGYFITVHPSGDVDIEDRERIYHQLSYWALSKMVEHTTEAELPFELFDFGNSKSVEGRDGNERRHTYPIPPELVEAIHEWEASGGELETSMNYLRNYIHVSHGSRNDVVNRPANDNTRRIFFNNGLVMERLG